jgi:hypothetical protein
VKRTVLVLTGLIAILLAACAPTSLVATNVVPRLISASPPNADGEVLLQGRYFGGGGEGSYVLVGANMNGEGGVEATVASWATTRITFAPPAQVGPGYVFVVVGGTPSNGLPLDLP